MAGAIDGVIGAGGATGTGAVAMGREAGTQAARRRSEAAQPVCHAIQEKPDVMLRGMNRPSRGGKAIVS